MALISLISVLRFIIYFLILALSFNYSSFSNYLRWKLRLPILDLSSFLVYALKAINFPLSTTFVAFHKFQYVVIITVVRTKYVYYVFLEKEHFHSYVISDNLPCSRDFFCEINIVIPVFFYLVLT